MHVDADAAKHKDDTIKKLQKKVARLQNKQVDEESSRTLLSCSSFLAEIDLMRLALSDGPESEDEGPQNGNLFTSNLSFICTIVCKIAGSLDCSKCARSEPRISRPHAHHPHVVAFAGLIASLYRTIHMSAHPHRTSVIVAKWMPVLIARMESTTVLMSVVRAPRYTTQATSQMVKWKEGQIRFVDLASIVNSTTELSSVQQF